jgi:predicted amidophosphoribosyltransferase
MVATHPMQINGAWRQGYVLDYHTVSSGFLGHNEFGKPMFDTKRTEMGELLYRLKYKRDLKALDPLVAAVADFVKGWQISFAAIVPVPPTRVRQVQPVFEVGDRLAGFLGLPILKDYVQAIKKSKELKNSFDYDERMKLLENAYRVRDQSVAGKAVLLFDDLFRSGATLNAVTRVLYEQAQCSDVYALALTRTRMIS